MQIDGKVYIVFEEDWEYGLIDKVYSTREAAEARVTELEAMGFNGPHGAQVAVEEHQVLIGYYPTHNK